MKIDLFALIALTLAAIPALIFLWNLPQVKPPAAGSGQDRPTPVSVLIPARNEAANIGLALSSVLANWGIEFEVIVLNDHSEDETAEIVQLIALRDSRVRLESAPPLPAGWCGKQHACHVLSRLSRHSLLVFMDADVRLAPDALARMSRFMTQRSGDAKSKATAPLGLASGVPRQITGTLSEKLLLPLIHFVLLGFLPIWRMRRCTRPAYGAGCGQLFIAWAEAYDAAGGHAAIRDSLHDGLKLPRAFRRAGYRTELFDATDVASCRMYRDWREVLDGLTKNAHEGLAAPRQIGIWTILLFGGQVLPWILLTCDPGVIGWSLIASALTLLPRALAAWRFRQSWFSVALHPLAIGWLLAIQWRALFFWLTRQPRVWKGRNYNSKPKLLGTPQPAASPTAAIPGIQR